MTRSSWAVGVGFVTAAAALLAAAAYLLVGGLPGALYAAGLAMAGVFVALRLRSRRRLSAPAARRRWRRKSVIITELRAELVARQTELGELQRGFDALGARLEQELGIASSTQARLESRVHELERSRDAALELLRDEQARFKHSLEELSGGLGQRRTEITALEREFLALLTV